MRGRTYSGKTGSDGPDGLVSDDYVATSTKVDVDQHSRFSHFALTRPQPHA